MPKKWTPEQAKKASEDKIIKALVIESPLRQKELLKYTQLSSKTLHEALSRMRYEGLVKRKMGDCRIYPRPVYYGLTKKGKRQVVARAFSLVLSIDPLFKPDLIKDEMELDVILEEVGRIVGAIHLFAILKSLEYKDLNWLDQIHDYRIDLNLFSKFIIDRFIEPEELDLEKDIFKEIKDNREKPYYFQLEEDTIKKIMISLQEVYPDIIVSINNQLKEDEHYFQDMVKVENDE